MKKITKISLAITFMACAVIIQFAFKQNANNFIGSWLRNNEKSDGGGLSVNSIPFKLEVSEKEGVITLVATNKNKEGEISTYTDLFKLDGTGIKRPAGANTKYTNVKWSADNKTLIETGIYKDADGNIVQSISDTFSVSEDRKTLSVVDNRKYKDGTSYTLTGVYDKQ